MEEGAGGLGGSRSEGKYDSPPFGVWTLTFVLLRNLPQSGPNLRYGSPSDSISFYVDFNCKGLSLPQPGYSGNHILLSISLYYFDLWKIFTKELDFKNLFGCFCLLYRSILMDFNAVFVVQHRRPRLFKNKLQFIKTPSMLTATR